MVKTTDLRIRAGLEYYDAPAIRSITKEAAALIMALFHYFGSCVYLSNEANLMIITKRYYHVEQFLSIGRQLLCHYSMQWFLPGQSSKLAEPVSRLGYVLYRWNGSKPLGSQKKAGLKVLHPLWNH